ncbi:MAG: glycosyltransferase family 4 protein [Burkholderiaceae bacterium]|jgi:glycosyltransferase involved in cell wall biosynthesis
MRILYHHRTQGEEPESIHIESIVAALRALGHEVRIVGPVDIEHRAPAATAPTARKASRLVRIKESVPRSVFELLQIAYNAVAWRRLDRAVREFKPDFIYERYALYAFAGGMVARRHGVPLILECNTPYAQAWAKYYGLHLPRLARWLEAGTLRSSDHVITVTHAQGKLLQQVGVRPERLTVSHNAIDPEWFSQERQDDPTLRERLGLKGLVIGFVGTMNRWQGIPKFAEVIPNVLERYPQASFLFVGDGEFRRELEDLCRAGGMSDRVVFVGRQPHDKVPAFVAAMDIAVLLDSNAYGSPMKIFEYWGMGKPVVAPSVAPVLEVMRDRETGLLIEPGNAAQLADRIVELASDPALRARLGAAGRACATASHTWRNNAEQIVAAHSALAEDFGRSPLKARP